MIDEVIAVQQKHIIPLAWQPGDFAATRGPNRLAVPTAKPCGDEMILRIPELYGLPNPCCVTGSQVSRRTSPQIRTALVGDEEFGVEKLEKPADLRG